MSQPIFPIVVYSALFVISLLLVIGILKINKRNDISGQKDKENCESNYISPMPFKTGFVENSPQNSASVCYPNNNAVRYPINLPFVNYGSPQISDKCPCTEFIQAP